MSRGETESSARWRVSRSLMRGVRVSELGRARVSVGGRGLGVLIGDVQGESRVAAMSDLVIVL